MRGAAAFFIDARRFAAAGRFGFADRFDVAERFWDAERLTVGRRLLDDFFALDLLPRRAPPRLAPAFFRDFFALAAMCLPSESVVMMAKDDSRNWTQR
ncbi:MAG: hypothetical protein ACHQWU_10765 [Gemmatimonadales bacterium]